MLSLKCVGVIMISNVLVKEGFPFFEKNHVKYSPSRMLNGEFSFFSGFA